MYWHIDFLRFLYLVFGSVSPVTTIPHPLGKRGGSSPCRSCLYPLLYLRSSVSPPSNSFTTTDRHLHLLPLLPLQWSTFSPSFHSISLIPQFYSTYLIRQTLQLPQKEWSSWSFWDDIILSSSSRVFLSFETNFSSLFIVVLSSIIVTYFYYGWPLSLNPLLRSYSFILKYRPIFFVDTVYSSYSMRLDGRL